MTRDKGSFTNDVITKKTQKLCERSEHKINLTLLTKIQSMNESLSKFDRQGAIRGLEQVLRKKFRNFVMRQEMRAIASIS